MKKIFSFLALFAAAVMFMVTSASAATVLPTDTSEPRSGCTFLGIEGKYITQIQESLDMINKYRLEACNEGVENPATGKPLTPNDYVPIQWSADMEYIARLRAAEASVTMAHARTNGESIWFKSPNGVQSFGEVIAWNWGETMTHGIDQWYGEKKDWVNKTGGVTGHYKLMINPNNRYVGLATFYSKLTKYPNTTVGEFCRKITNPDTSRGSSTGNIIQTVEVKNDCISYEISGTDTLSVSAAVTFKDYKSEMLKTDGLTLVGKSADKVQWSSSNNSMSVSNGKLTVNSCGSATITAKLPDGTTLTKNVSNQHAYETATTPATCKSEGKTVKRCKICGDTVTQTIPVTNQHSYETATTPATCKAEGKTVKKCRICGNTVTQTIPATNQHSYETATTPATCKDDGKTVKRCKICGDTVTQIIPKTNNHSYETATTQATCKTEGRTVKTCRICGDTDTQIIPKTNRHSFGSWVTTKTPTANSDGLETRTCAVCDAKETRTLQYKPQNNQSSSSSSSSVSSSSSSSSASSSSSSSSVSSSSSSSASSSSDSSSVSSSSSSSSVSSSSDSSSVSSSSDSSSVSSSSDNSDSSSNDSSSVPSLSDNSDSSSNDSTPVIELSNKTNNDDISNGGNFSNLLVPIAIITGVLFAAAVVLVICIVSKRKKK